MASNVGTIELKVGENRQYTYTIKNGAQTAVVDITGWTLSWMVKKRVTDTDANAILTKTTTAGGIAISGIFNADPLLNTQKATVSIADTDTNGKTPGEYAVELKRMDVGAKTPLAEGRLRLLKGVHG